MLFSLLLNYEKNNSSNMYDLNGCVYCKHKYICWSDTNQGKGLRVFNYAKGKRFLVQVIVYLILLTSLRFPKGEEIFRKLK